MKDLSQPGTSKQALPGENKTAKRDSTTNQRQKLRKEKAGSPKRKAQQPTKRSNISQFETKSKQALAQSKLEQAKRRQRRHSSTVSTDLDKGNNSDTRGSVEQVCASTDSRI